MPLDGTLLAARLLASRVRSKHVAGAVERGANWSRQHRSASLTGHVKRSPSLQRALYATLDYKPFPSEEDAAYMRARLLPEIVKLEEMVGIDPRARWKWPT